MKNLLLVIFITLVAGATVANSQCSVPAGFVCITQSAADSIAHDLDELKASRVALAKATAQITLTDAERNAAQTLIKAMGDAFDARGRIVADQAAMIDLQQKVITLYSTLVEKLTHQLNAPKSGWSKFVGVLEKVVVLLAGVAIGSL